MSDDFHVWLTGLALVLDSSAASYFSDGVPLFTRSGSGFCRQPLVGHF